MADRDEINEPGSVEVLRQGGTVAASNGASDPKEKIRPFQNLCDPAGGYSRSLKSARLLGPAPSLRSFRHAGPTIDYSTYPPFIFARRTF